jgi:hypothetical protein
MDKRNKWFTEMPYCHFLKVTFPHFWYSENCFMQEECIYVDSQEIGNFEFWGFHSGYFGL